MLKNLSVVLVGEFCLSAGTGVEMGTPELCRVWKASLLLILFMIFIGTNIRENIIYFKLNKYKENVLTTSSDFTKPSFSF